MAGNKKGLSVQDTSLFFANLGMLLQGGMNPEECSRVMAEDMAGTACGHAAASMVAAFDSGRVFSVSEALQSTGLFSHYAVQMVQLGEVAGQLDSCAQELGDYYNNQDIMDKNIQQAIYSPLILLGTMGGVLLFFAFVVLPVFEQVFLALNVLDVGMSAFGVARGLVAVVWLLFALLLLARLLGDKPAIRRAARGSFVGRHVYNDICLSRLTQGIALLLHSGISPEIAVEKAAQTVQENKTLCGKIVECHNRLLVGEDLGHVMVSSGLLYGMEAKMLISASRTGQQAPIMRRLSKIYSDNAIARIQGMLNWLEPVLVGVMCAVVAGVLVSMLLPLAQIAKIL